MTFRQLKIAIRKMGNGHDYVDVWKELTRHKTNFFTFLFFTNVKKVLVAEEFWRISQIHVRYCIIPFGFMNAMNNRTRDQFFSYFLLIYVHSIMTAFQLFLIKLFLSTTVFDISSPYSYGKRNIVDFYIWLKHEYCC